MFLDAELSLGATNPWAGLLCPLRMPCFFRFHLLGSSGFNGLKTEEAEIWDSGSYLDQLKPVHPGILGLALPGLDNILSFVLAM